MNALLPAAVWVHLAACALLTGSFALLLMAGPPAGPAMRRWEGQLLAAARWLSVVALLSNFAWLAVRTALFEGRPEAALEVDSIARAMLDTWPGVVWMARQGLLLLLAAFLWLGGQTPSRPDWIAARGEALLLSALALVLVGTSSHSAAISTDLWPRLVDMVHLLAAGIWVGGLPALALLLRAAGRGAAGPDAQAVRTMRRFSAVALVAVLALAATGTATALLLVEDVAGLVGTTHGRLLLGKLAILVPALLLAAASRALLPRLSGPAEPVAVARRMAWFVALEAGLVLLVLGLAAMMTVTTPARHGDPRWPLPVRLVLDVAGDPWLVPAAALAGLLLVLAALFAFRQRLFAAAVVVVALALGATAALRPLAVQAFPTSFAQAPVTYHAGSIATGARLYRERCATCHEAGGAVDLRSDAVRQRTAGELFWLIGHGHGPSAPDLDETRRWDLVNFIRAMDAASDPRAIRPKVEPDDGWLVAPDFTIAVGPLAPRSLRDFRGARMVLLVLYDLPASRDRMTELARRSGTLSVLGVEVVAVSPRSSPAAIGALGSNPPAYFPVVTAGNEDIVSTYRLFAPGTAHAELLIDRQGYIRAIWRSDATGMPDAAAVQAEVERLNAEKAPPPLPDDHVH